MAEGKEWDRREFDRLAKQGIAKALQRLEDKIDGRLEVLADRVNELDEFLRGGKNNDDPLGTRVHLCEETVHQLKLVVFGDALGRGSLVEMIKATSELAKEAKKIAEGKVDQKIRTREQMLSLILGLLSLIGVITVGILGNWDKIERAFGKMESPDQYAARMTKDIERLKQTRGPEVDKILKGIEKAARRRS